MEKKEIKNFVFYVAGVGITLFIFIFFVTASWIGYGVKERCESAKNKYGGDCIGALMNVVEDKEADNTEKADAIWALGQLGDKKALDFLKKYQDFSGNNKECIHKESVCYELKKAIKLLENDFNITAFVWR